MEEMDQNYGFALYHTKIPKKFLSSIQELQVPSLGDRGIVFVGKVSWLSFFLLPLFHFTDFIVLSTQLIVSRCLHNHIFASTKAVKDRLNEFIIDRPPKLDNCQMTSLNQSYQI